MREDTHRVAPHFDSQDLERLACQIAMRDHVVAVRVPASALPKVLPAILQEHEGQALVVV